MKDTKAVYGKGKARSLDRRLGYVLADLIALRAEYQRVISTIDSATEFARCGEHERVAQILKAEQRIRLRRGDAK